MALLSLTFFGDSQAAFAGKPLTTFRSSKVQALLIYLAMTAHKTHARNVLAALLWPDDSDAVAKKNLRQSLYQLRQVLEEDSQEVPFLLVTRSTAQFNLESDHSLDVTDFRNHLEQNQLEQAVDLYRGELLPGFSGDSPPFEEWLRDEREELHRLALDALFELARHSLARADYSTAREYARRQLAQEPWREEAHRQLIQALALLGERSAALAQYETCRTVLAEELHAVPSPETEALVDRIRNKGLETDPKPINDLPYQHRRLTVPFIGRKNEHSKLVRTYQRATRDSCQVVALVGEAGIGKTRLAGNFLDWASTQGADILHGQAFETSGRLSYQPLTQVLRRRLERENAPEDLLSDLWLTQLSQILPELRDRYPDLPAPTQEESTAQQHLFEAIARLGLALAGRSPLLIFIDDWHWADSASLDVLHYAVLRWLEEGASILVFLTLRQETILENSNLQTWLARLKHDAAFEQINLATLTETETEQLIRTLIESEDIDNDKPLSKFGRWLFEETDGQPFFLVELLKTLVEEKIFQPNTNSEVWHIDWAKFNEETSGSRVLPRIREIIQGWLDRISALAGALLTAAAVLGQRATFEFLYPVAGIDEFQALEALDELLAKQMLLEIDEGLTGPAQDIVYSFSHQKLSEVVYTEAGAARRRILHNRAFETLEEAQAPAAELAHHALHAGLWSETIQQSLAAGVEAMSLHAVKVAITHFETALQLVEQQGWPEAVSGADRQDLYSSLGRAYELIEAWQQAEETYQTMITYARTIGATSLECLGLNRLATVNLHGLKNFQHTVALLEQAQMVAEQSEDRRGLAETKWNLSLVARMEQDTFLSRQHGEEALEMAREMGHPQLLARCLNSLAYVHGQLRQWDSVETYAKEAGDLYTAAGNRILEADSQRMVGWSQMYVGRPQDSLFTLQETLVFSQQIDNLWGETESSWRLAKTLLELGRYNEAIKLAEQGVSKARMVGLPKMIFLALSTWGCVQRTVYALDGALETFMDIQEEHTEISTVYIDWVLEELCVIYALSGEWNKAHDYARQALESRTDLSLLPMSFTGWYETEAFLRHGDDDLAKAEVERLKNIVKSNKRFRIPLLRSQAVLAEWEGDSAGAIKHLETAVKLAREIGLPGEEWPILGELGKLYEEQGNQTQSQKALGASVKVIHHLAEFIDEDELREGFLTAEPVRSILVSTKANAGT